MTFPSDFEQYMLELVNRARQDPQGEANRFGISLNQGYTDGTVIDSHSKPPLAMHQALMDSARAHSLWMLKNNVFSHTGIDGSSSSERIFAAGWSSENGGYALAENVAVDANTDGDVAQDLGVIEEQHRGLFESPGHRKNLLSNRYAEIGIGQQVGSFTWQDAGPYQGKTFDQTSMITQNFAEGGRRYLLGVIIDDRDGDAFYDPGEGMSGMTISATGDNGDHYSTTSWDSGGYQLALPNGRYEVAISGKGLTNIRRFDVTIDQDNVKQDVLKRYQQEGDASNDIFRADLAPESFDGKQGRDTVSYGGAGSIKLDLLKPLQNLGWAKGDRLTDIEKIEGSARRDVIKGDRRGNILAGQAGNDRLDGRAGKDRLLGQAGKDSLRGNTGDDLLFGQRGNDLLIGGAGRDRLNGGSGADRFRLTNPDAADQIDDFNRQQGDTLEIARAGFGHLPRGILDITHLRLNRSGSAEDSDDFFIFDTTTGDLYYDPNGSAAGGARRIATLSGVSMLKNTDIVVV